ncbi:hypothetical protein BpHYR1_050041 [Brachionus plicatilis]|uniref:Uncharacterized protein n=1 Tax=Brachionus plicatilis TaxID=10195 RepID=A0A3M7R5T0_BRAPC|nr:hypothetical protein BpHYR1_050041 [Brachionus plicatilis]
MGRRSSPYHVPFFEQRLRPDTEFYSQLSSYSRVLINQNAMLPSFMLVSINQRYLLSVPY